MIVTHPNGIVRVELDYIGEGFGGDYDQYDSDDEPLMRFTVERLRANGEWEPYDDGSYCTLLSLLHTSDEIHQRACEIILDEVAGWVTSGSSIKRACERLSWLGHEGYFPELYDQPLAK